MSRVVSHRYLENCMQRRNSIVSKLRSTYLGTWLRVVGKASASSFFFPPCVRCDNKTFFYYYPWINSDKNRNLENSNFSNRGLINLEGIFIPDPNPKGGVIEVRQTRVQVLLRSWWHAPNHAWHNTSWLSWKRRGETKASRAISNATNPPVCEIFVHLFLQSRTC